MIRKIKKGQKVFSQNDKSREMYFIESGSIKILQHKNGRNTDLAILEKGALLGEMAMIDGKPRSATAVAQEDSELVVVTQEEFQNKVATVPPWYLALLRITSERLRKSNQTANLSNQIQILSAVARFLALTIRQAKRNAPSKTEEAEIKTDLKRVKQELVNVLGLKRKTITTALCILEKHGLILMFSNTLRVADTEELESLSTFLAEYRPDENSMLLEDGFFTPLSSLQNLLKQNAAGSQILSFNLADFKSQFGDKLPLPEGEMDSFLENIQQAGAAKFILPDASETSNLKLLADSGNLTFDCVKIKKIIREENFKRMGIL